MLEFFDDWFFTLAIARLLQSGTRLFFYLKQPCPQILACMQYTKCMQYVSIFALIGLSLLLCILIIVTPINSQFNFVKRGFLNFRFLRFQFTYRLSDLISSCFNGNLFFILSVD